MHVHDKRYKLRALRIFADSDIVGGTFYMSADPIQKNATTATISLPKRPPVVVVMGHVDHGKTTLLDTIRKANIAAKEAGGITQSVGAYEIVYRPQINADPSAQIGADKNQRESAPSEGERITFIDTPGHEAFIKMRTRGASIADIAILVVAVDDGVQPQTKEAIKIILEAELPYIVAINKIDKAPDELPKVKNQLAEAGVLLEGYGGTVSSEAISAKTGAGVPELLDLILLTAEGEEFTYDPKLPGEGVILEAKMDARRGPVATAIVKNGILKVGDEICVKSCNGKIRQLEDFEGKAIKEAFPSSPVLILGLTTIPPIGETFRVGIPGEISAPQNSRKATGLGVPSEGPAVKDENRMYLLLKSDSAGSLEALLHVISAITLPTTARIQIVDATVGDITDGDVKQAIAKHAAIVGFRVKLTKPAETLATAHKVIVLTSPVIYELVKQIDDNFIYLKADVIAGSLKVLRVFENPTTKTQVIGGEVTVGQIKTNTPFEIIRGNRPMGKGKTVNIQKDKKDVPALQTGEQGGMLVEIDTPIKEGDVIVIR